MLLWILPKVAFLMRQVTRVCDTEGGIFDPTGIHMKKEDRPEPDRLDRPEPDRTDRNRTDWTDWNRTDRTDRNRTGRTGPE